MRDTLRCRELSGLLEGIVVLLDSLSTDLRMGSLVDLGEVAGSLSKDNKL